MCTLAAIGVNNNLTTSQASIAMRATNNELSRWVDKVLDVITKQGQHLLRMNLLLDTRNEDVDDIILDLLEHSLVIRIKFIMLSGNNNGVDTLRHTCITVLDGHLTLGVRTQVGHYLALLTDVCQCPHDEMCQIKTDRH